MNSDEDLNIPADVIESPKEVSLNLSPPESRLYEIVLCIFQFIGQVKAIKTLGTTVNVKINTGDQE